MPWPPSIAIDHASSSVTISSPSPGVSPATHINAALQQAVDAAIANDIFPVLSRTHSEPFRILGARCGGDGDGSSPVVQVERFAASLFGIATRGAHMTCYVRDRSTGLPSSIWVARRSRTLHTYPGKLDSTVAGGVKADDSPTGCILAEAMEEATLDVGLVRERARPVGVLTLANRSARTGLFHTEVLYVYDMELPDGVVPTPSDGEVETFELMGVEEMRVRMEAGEFKPNVCAVMIDFMVRHGLVTPESEGEGAYLAICNRLRRRLPMPTAPDDF